MASEKIIRETLLYRQRYHHQTIVVKLGAQVVEQAEKLEILSDIVHLKLSGIKIIITHANPEVEPQEWISLDNMGLAIDLGSLDEIGYYTLNKIPIIYCCPNHSISVDAVIAQVAIEVNAIKLVYATYRDGIFSSDGKIIHQMTVDQARNMLNQKLITGGMREKVESAIMACKAGIPRIHIINGFREGALLKELFTSEGVGTMIYDQGTPYQLIQPARLIDTVGIVSVLKTADLKATIVFEDIAQKIKQFVIYKEDNQIHGCMMMNMDQPKICEIVYLASSTPYEPQLVMQELLSHAIDCATLKGKKYIYIEGSKNNPWLTFYPWFYQLSFQEKTTDQCDWHPQNNPSQKLWVKVL